MIMNDTLVTHWSLMLDSKGPEAVAEDIRRTVDREPRKDDSYTSILLALAREAIDIRIAQWAYESHVIRWMTGVEGLHPVEQEDYPLLVQSRRVRERELLPDGA